MKVLLEEYDTEPIIPKAIFGSLHFIQKEKDPHTTAFGSKTMGMVSLFQKS